jgi:hypothetical protein
MVLHGWWALRDFGDLVLDGSAGRATLLAAGRVEQVRRESGGMQVTLSSSLDEAQVLRARLVDLEPSAARVAGARAPIEQLNGQRFVTFTLPARQQVTLEIDGGSASGVGVGALDG